MADGRWVDDAYSGAPRRGHAGPRLLRFTKWTWPLLFVLMGVFTAWWGDPYGWLAGMAVYALLCVVPRQMDQAAEKAGHHPSR